MALFLGQRFNHYPNLVSHQYTVLDRYQHSSRALLFHLSWCSKNRRHFPSSDLHRDKVYCSIYKLGGIKIGPFVSNVVNNR